MEHELPSKKIWVYAEHENCQAFLLALLQMNISLDRIRIDQGEWYVRRGYPEAHSTDFVQVWLDPKELTLLQLAVDTNIYTVDTFTYEDDEQLAIEVECGSNTREEALDEQSEIIEEHRLENPQLYSKLYCSRRQRNLEPGQKLKDFLNGLADE